ncbi:MAG: GNAT family N-acetyltransferase [Phenylobacterium sp.]|nr:GNAT family N-acetyltransferase [Phenylobacterium sp.]
MTTSPRLAVEADLEHLPGIELSAASAFEGRDVPAFLFTDFAPAEAYRPHLNGGTLWVIDDGQAPVAFLAARVEGDRLHIDELDVRRDQQGQGLGRRLLEQAAQWSRDQGLARLSLTTFRDIPWNAPFYARFGFRAWPVDEAPATIRQALRNEAAKGLANRCAMVMDV